MRTLRFLFLVAVASLLGLAQAQITREGFVPLDHPEMYDGTSIVTALEPAWAERLPGGPRWFAVQRARVEDSRAFAKGTIVKVYQNYRPQGRDFSLMVLAGTPISQAGALPVGARSLIVDARSIGSVLRTPDPLKNQPQEERRDLYAAADDPLAFPEGVGRAWWAEYPGTFPDMFPKGHRRYVPPTQAQFVAILRTANSPTIAVYILEDLPKPSDADAKSLARLLDSPDPRLRFAFVKRLAAWYGLGAPEEPRPELVGGATRIVYPGLDDLVAAWKARLAKL